MQLSSDPLPPILSVRRLLGCSATVSETFSLTSPVKGETFLVAMPSHGCWALCDINFGASGCHSWLLVNLVQVMGVGRLFSNGKARPQL